MLRMAHIAFRKLDFPDALAPYMAVIGDCRESLDSVNLSSRVIEKDCSSRKLLKFEKLKSISIGSPRKCVLLF